MLFLMVITLWSLVGQALQFTRGARAEAGVPVLPQVASALVAVLLFALTAFLVFEASRVVSRPRPTAPVETPGVRAA